MKKIIITLFLLMAMTAFGQVTTTPFSRNLLQETNGAKYGELSGQMVSIAIVPDPQTLIQRDTNQWLAQCRYLETNRMAMNLVGAVITGDGMLDPGGQGAIMMSNGLALLTNVPFVWSPGNHDYDDGAVSNRGTAWWADMSNFNKTMPTFLTNKLDSLGRTRGQSLASYQYMADDPLYALANTSGSTNKENHAFTVTNNGNKFLFIGAEFAPRSNSLWWATNLIGRYSNHTVVYGTHLFLQLNQERRFLNQYGGASAWYYMANGSHTDDGKYSDGERVWDYLKPWPNVRFIVSGHDADTYNIAPTNRFAGYFAETGINNNTIHQFCVNAQYATNGPIHVITFNPKTFEGYTWMYNPYSNVFYRTIRDEHQLPPATGYSDAETHILNFRHGWLASANVAIDRPSIWNLGGELDLLRWVANTSDGNDSINYRLDIEPLKGTNLVVSGTFITTNTSTTNIVFNFRPVIFAWETNKINGAGSWLTISITEINHVIPNTNFYSMSFTTAIPRVDFPTTMRFGSFFNRRTNSSLWCTEIKVRSW